MGHCSIHKKGGAVNISNVVTVNMNNWQIDLLAVSELTTCTEDIAFQHIEQAAKDLGFEYCSYGFQTPLPYTNPKTVILSNYQEAWKNQYEREGYLLHDPAVKHCRKSARPFIWADEPIGDAKDMWEAARAFGLRHGWAQSNLSVLGGAGMLTLSRSTQRITSGELDALENKMQWLANISHFTLSRLIMQRMRSDSTTRLTAKEAEILKWCADGKTSGEIAQILSISDNTVNFHVKNVIQKLQVTNKTAAVIRAALMGLLT